MELGWNQVCQGAHGNSTAWRLSKGSTDWTSQFQMFGVCRRLASLLTYDVWISHIGGEKFLSLPTLSQQNPDYPHSLALLPCGNVCSGGKKIFSSLPLLGSSSEALQIRLTKGIVTREKHTEAYCCALRIYVEASCVYISKEVVKTWAYGAH